MQKKEAKFKHLTEKKNEVCTKLYRQIIAVL